MIQNNTWYVGDSFELIKQIESKSVDMILTDPPYDLSYEQKMYLQLQFHRICNGVIIVFAPPENQWISGADQYLFWIKPISTKNTSRSYSRFVEMIHIYGRLRWNNNRHWSQYTNVFTDLVDDNGIHPFRKPPSLIGRLMLNHSNPGDVVFDPFAGSGVVVDKAIELGRNFIAFEKEEKYSRERFEQWMNISKLE